jgi:hypothetical protein
MGGRFGNGGGRRLIGAGAKGAFVLALRGGARLDEAARAAGFSLPGMYAARARDPVFAAAWKDALAHSSAPRLIAANNKRGWQLRRMRQLVFTEERKQLFLEHFAGTCDAVAAAEAAGVTKSCVYKAAQRDPEFRAGWEEALAIGYASLEAEAVRQRLAMQERLRAGIEPKGEAPAEFERVMKLLARYERRGGRVGFHGPGEGRLARWSFDEAIEALDKKLRALGLRQGVGDGSSEAGAGTA